MVPSILPGVDPFFVRALAKDRTQRFQSPREFCESFAALCLAPRPAKILVVDDELDVQHMARALDACSAVRSLMASLARRIAWLETRRMRQREGASAQGIAERALDPTERLPRRPRSPLARLAPLLFAAATCAAPSPILTRAPTIIAVPAAATAPTTATAPSAAPATKPPEPHPPAETAQPSPRDEALERGFDLMRIEHFGGLRLGLSEEQVVAELGAPVRGKEVEWGATGDHVEDWDYPSKGVHLWMASDEPGGKKRVLSLRITAPSKLKTHKNIGIGSSGEEVRRAYKEYEDTSRADTTNPNDLFVAGTVYGGVLFTMAAGKVTEIFVGAASE